MKVMTIIIIINKNDNQGSSKEKYSKWEFLIFT